MYILEDDLNAPNQNAPSSNLSGSEYRHGINLLLEKETSKMNDSLLDLVGIAENEGYPTASERHDKIIKLFYLPIAWGSTAISQCFCITPTVHGTPIIRN
jgi:hypothetical protein